MTNAKIPSAPLNARLCHCSDPYCSLPAALVGCGVWGQVVEPSFYYRMQSDMRVQPPRAATLRFDLSGREQKQKEVKLDEGKDRSTGDVAAEPEANTGENNVGSSGLSGFNGGQSSGSRSAGESEGSARGGDLLEQLLLRLLKFEDTRVVIDLIDLELGKDYRGGKHEHRAVIRA